MTKALTRTDFNFPKQKDVYHGKVRDVYNINDEYLVMVVSDRISAFDVVLGEDIPHKGQVLTETTRFWFDETAELCPNYVIEVP